MKDFVIFLETYIYKYCDLSHFLFGSLFSLLNAVSIFAGYFELNLSRRVEVGLSNALVCVCRGGHTINPNMNVIARLEFELAYYDVAAH